jgi:hypothetical protein
MLSVRLKLQVIYGFPRKLSHNKTWVPWGSPEFIGSSSMPSFGLPGVHQSACAAALSASHPFLIPLPLTVTMHILGYVSVIETKILIALWSCTCTSRYLSYNAPVHMSKNKFQQLRGLLSLSPCCVWMTIIANGFRGITPMFFLFVDEVMRQHRLTHLCLRFGQKSILHSQGNEVLRRLPSNLSGLQLFCEYYGPSEIYCFLSDLMRTLPSSLELLTVTVANIPSRKECFALMMLFFDIWVVEDDIYVPDFDFPPVNRLVVRLFHQHPATSLGVSFQTAAQNVAATWRKMLGGGCRCTLASERVCCCPLAQSPVTVQFQVDTFHF